MKTAKEVFDLLVASPTEREAIRILESWKEEIDKNWQYRAINIKSTSDNPVVHAAIKKLLS